MNERFTLKEIIDDKINKDDIYCKIVSKKEKKPVFKHYVLIAVIGIWIFGFIKEVIPRDKIRINRMDAITFDMNIKYIKEDIKDMLLDIPQGLNKEEYRVYTQKELEGSYDLFLWNMIVYENNDISIRISFSDKGIEMRDWFIIGGEKESFINENKVIIQKYGESNYISHFDFKGNNYLIESNGLDELGVIRLLKSILK